MQSLLRRFVLFILSHKVAVLCFVGAVSLTALSVLPRAVIASSVKAMFFGDHHEGYNEYTRRIAEFGSDEVFLFGVEVAEPMSADTLKKLRRFEELAMERLPEVKRITSLGNLERVGLSGDTIGVRSYAEEVFADPTRAGPLLEEIRADPIAGDLLVGRNGRDVMVLVEMSPDDSRSAETGPLKLAALTRALIDAGFPEQSVHRGGLAAIIAEMVLESRVTLMRLFPLVCLCLLIAVYLMFGRTWPAFVTTVSASIAVLWAAAFSVYREPQVNITMSILPAFVMVISFSDVVHLCGAYLLNIESGREKREAIVDATVHVGMACFLTSVTTAVGFFSMMWIPAPAFAHLGLASGVGVVIAYLLAMVLVPIILDYFPPPKSWHGGRVGSIQRWLDDLLGLAAELSINRPWSVIAVFFGITALLGFGASRIHFETDFSKRLRDDNPMRVDERYLERQFVPATVIELYVDTEGEGGVLDPETFAGLVRFEAALEAMPEVEKAVSLVDLMRATHRSIVGPDADFGPFGADELAQMMVLLEMQGVDALRPYVDFPRSSTRITVYSNVRGIVAQHQLRQQFYRAAHTELGDRAQLTATGIGPLMGEWLDDILRGQRRGLLFSIVIISLLLILGFRSVRAGLVSMVPNLIPLLAAGAYCGYFWDQTDSDTLVVGMIALGIGVDDTIHFIARYKLEEARNPDRATALRETFRYSGRGIFITTFVFVVGFAPLITSEYLSIWAMGLLLPICFVVALAADLLLVPAMIRVGWIGFRRRS